MQTPKNTPLAEFIRGSSWPSLLIGAFLYSLGAGIVVFRGEFFNWTNFWIGLAMLLLLLLSSFYLNEYFTRLQNSPRRGEKSISDESGVDNAALKSNIFLLAAITTLTAGAMITVLLFSTGAFNLIIWLMLGISFLLAFIYAVPPFRLANTGYGELAMAVLLTNLFPALSYLLQTGEMSDLLGMLTFPLTVLYLAMVLALSLETYYSDLKAGRQNLMIRLGWQRGMALHNMLIVAAYLLVGVGAVAGMAWALTWPKLLTLPIGLFQAWQIWAISRGAKPRWNLLKLTAYATFGITLYLQVFTLWVG